MSSGWIIGYTVGVIIVLLVVVLLLLLIRSAHRAAVKAEACLAALHETKSNSDPLWAVNDVSEAVRRITSSAGAVREHLAKKHLGV